MEFEEMQVIWDSQREQEMYAIDIDAMHRTIKRKARKVERSINLNEIGMMVICVFVALESLREPVLEQTDYHNIFGSVVMLCVAGWMLMKRSARLKMRSQFDSTLTGDLDRAIAESKAQLLLARTFHWWFMLPAASIILVSIIVKSENRNPVVILGLSLGMALAIAVVHLGIRCMQVPEQRNLQALRDTLTKQG
ncbi:MAG: hypothetical protein ACI84O_001398 [Myxococcota bacterium]|jgi:hypothetical protein